MLATNRKLKKTPCGPNKTHSQAELAHRLPAFGLWLKGNGQNQKQVEKQKQKTWISFRVSPDFQAPQETNRRALRQSPTKHSTSGLQKSYELLEVARDIPCSSPNLLQFPQNWIHSPDGVSSFSLISLSGMSVFKVTFFSERPSTLFWQLSFQ